MADYDTPLSEEDQTDFNNKYSPEDSADYDMQGWYKDNKNSDHAEGEHYPDTYKKPNHPTFSDESKYHGTDGNEGGSWHMLSDNKFAFRPGSTNFSNHNTQELSDYFKKVEPNNYLLLAGEDIPIISK